MTALEYIAEVKARAKAATPGPWYRVEANDGRAYVCRYDGEGLREPVLPVLFRETDGDFCAAARADVDRLVAMVEAAHAEIERLRVELAERNDPAIIVTLREVRADNARLREALERSDTENQRLWGFVEGLNQTPSSLADLILKRRKARALEGK